MSLRNRTVGRDADGREIARYMAAQVAHLAAKGGARRQTARWKAIEQAQLQGLSMRATARLLGISRSTVGAYVRAGGPPGRQPVASSTRRRADGHTR